MLEENHAVGVPTLRFSFAYSNRDMWPDRGGQPMRVFPIVFVMVEGRTSDRAPGRSRAVRDPQTYLRHVRGKGGICDPDAGVLPSPVHGSVRRCRCESAGAVLLGRNRRPAQGATRGGNLGALRPTQVGVAGYNVETGRGKTCQLFAQNQPIRCRFAAGSTAPSCEPALVGTSMRTRGSPVILRNSRAVRRSSVSRSLTAGVFASFRTLVACFRVAVMIPTP